MSFRWPFRWTELWGHGADVVPLLEERDRALEDHLQNLGGGGPTVVPAASAAVYSGDDWIPGSATWHDLAVTHANIDPHPDVYRVEPPFAGADWEELSTVRAGVFLTGANLFFEFDFPDPDPDDPDWTPTTQVDARLNAGGGSARVIAESRFVAWPSATAMEVHWSTVHQHDGGRIWAQVRNYYGDAPLRVWGEVWSVALAHQPMPPPPDIS